MIGGLGEKLCVLAIVMFAMMYSGTFRGAEGFTPWQQRFQDLEFKVYPFGALVLYEFADDAPVARFKKGSDKQTTRKWRNRLVPSILVGVTGGPGGEWARSYQVVPLSSILSEGRASRVSIRTFAAVAIPRRTISHTTKTRGWLPACGRPQPVPQRQRRQRL